MNDLFSVEGKVVVITGGSGFLGRQYVNALESAGARVVNWDLDVGVDITNPISLKSAMSVLLEEYGRLDVLINNAAFNPHVLREGGYWSAYESFPLDLWEDEIDANLTGQMMVTKAIVPAMMRQRSGSIIFVASDLALIGPNNTIYEAGRFKDIAYVASKAGVLGLMRAWASYLGPYNVRVNALVPGGMYRDQPEEFVAKNSALNMLGRMAKEGEYNGPIVFLASDASSYITGTCLVVDGGRTAW